MQYGISDKEYWENFYKSSCAVSIPSPFAEFCLKNYIRKNAKLIELGCGNGRDAFFFAKNHINVTALDQCESVIKALKRKYASMSNLNFVNKDFCSLPILDDYDIVYSRFTMHAINKLQQNSVLAWAYASVKNDGYFLIECRGEKNELFRKGNAVSCEDNAFIYDNHYRRFLNFEDTIQELESLGFEIILAKEERDFAPFKNENQFFIRIIAKK